MLHRGATSQYIHTRSDVDPSIIAGIAQVQLDAKRQQRHRTRPSHSAPTTAETGAAAVSSTRRRIHADHSITAVTPSVEISRDFRRGSGSINTWTGVRASMHRQTVETNGIVALPLEVLSPTKTHAPMATAATHLDGAFSTRRSFSGAPSRPTPPPAPVAPLLLVNRVAPLPASAHPRAHFVQPLRTERTRMRELQRQKLLDEEEKSPLPPPKRLVERGLTSASASLPLLEAPVPVQPRLTTAHLPEHLMYRPPPPPSDDGSDALVPVNNFTSANVVPDASIIFTRFHAWLVEQRAARAIWRDVQREREVEVQRRHEEREAARAEKAQAHVKRRQERARQRQWAREQRALIMEARRKADAFTLAHHSPSSSSGDLMDKSPLLLDDDDNDETAQDEELDDEAESPLSDADHSPISPPACFTPSLFSYPRLQYNTPHHGIVKFQPHLVEIEAHEEIQVVWTQIAEMMVNAERSDSKDAIVKDRVFAFRLDGQQVIAPATAPPAAVPATSAPSQSVSGFTSPTSGFLSPASGHRSPQPPFSRTSTLAPPIEATVDNSAAAASSVPVATHGFDDGLLVGTGGKLLHLLEQVDLSNVFILVTESGHNLGRIPLPATSERAARERESRALLLRTAKIMLQDFVRVRRAIDAENQAAAVSSATAIASTDSPPPLKLSDLSGSNHDALSSHHGNANGVSLYTIPLNSTDPPVPIPLDPNTMSAVPMGVTAGSVPSNAPEPELKFLTAAEEGTLKSEFLSLLSGHAFLKMNPLNLAVDHGRNRPYFMSLWQAYLARVHPPQERPDLAKMADAHAAAGVAGVRAAAAQQRAHFSQNEVSLSIESTAPSAVAASGGGGRMAASLQPNMTSSGRIAQKMHALGSGASALMLDGFPSDRPGRQRGRGASNISEAFPPSTSDTLALRRGAGFAGTTDLSPPRASHRRQHHGSDSKSMATSFDEMDEYEQYEYELLAAQQLELASRKSTLMHTSGSGGGAGQTNGPGAAMFLELQRAKSLKPSHIVQSHAQLYHQLLHVVYSFKAKYYGLRLSRAVLFQLTEVYPMHPPFLLRLIVLAIGILLKWPTLHWRSLRHYLRGEVATQTVSAFLTTDQTVWRLYLDEQEKVSALPPPLAPEKLARTMLERDEMTQRADQFAREYRAAVLFAESNSSHANGADSGSNSNDAVDDLPPSVLEPPRDLLAHLMSMDLLTMTPRAYEQVLILFSEPTLTKDALLALPPEFAPTAVLLYEWVLLTLRAYNVWQACRITFQAWSAAERAREAEAYAAYIRAIGKTSDEIWGDLPPSQSPVQALTGNSTRPMTPRIHLATKPLIPRQHRSSDTSTPKTPASRSRRPSIAPIPPINEAQSSRVNANANASMSANGNAPANATSEVNHSNVASPRGLAATLLSGNLLTLLSHERPAAGGSDEMVGTWLADPLSQPFGGYQRQMQEDSTSFRRMG